MQDYSVFFLEVHIQFLLETHETRQHEELEEEESNQDEQMFEDREDDLEVLDEMDDGLSCSQKI